MRSNTKITKVKCRVHLLDLEMSLSKIQSITHQGELVITAQQVPIDVKRVLCQEMRGSIRCLFFHFNQYSELHLLIITFNAQHTVIKITIPRNAKHLTSARNRAHTFIQLLGNYLGSIRFKNSCSYINSQP